MPQSGKLPPAVLADFETWIKIGAPDPRDGKQVVAAEIDWTKAREFWAFQAPIKHPLPKVKNAAWVKRDIDHFVLAELEKRNLKPVGLADRRDLIRRATFDLIGLPPTPEEIDAFLKDQSPDAFAKVVDRLLASPHHGERWGRYWLDVARYAEDKALAFVALRPHAYRYRDWVVNAINSDMPYDRFVRLQLAGDLLKEPEPDHTIKLAGLGFQGLGQEYHRGSVTAQVIADELDDRVDTLTRGLLGLTVSCARCHDHKYDPVPTRDYYSLAAAYNGANLTIAPLADAKTVERFQTWDKQVKDAEAKLKKIGKEKTPSEASKMERAALQAELDKLRKDAPQPLPMAHVVSGGGTAMKVHQRGNVERLGEPAPPGFLRILTATGPLRDSARQDASKFTRLELADAIATSKNPLTARVIVNRVWHYHFGRGIVGTTSNFGKLGDRPTHPELLDTLAVRFIENGWSLRWLHRELMLSTTYQLSSRRDAVNAESDPENQYLWRYTPRRLDFEAWRDAWLAVSGRLDATRGGPSNDLDKPDNVRRTIYAKVSRLEANKLMVLFDFPDANVTSDRRSVTTVPQQQLFVLNSAFTIETAKAFADRLEKSAAKDEDRVALAFRLAYCREPTREELAASVEFVRGAGSADRLSPWQQFAQAILASNEFLWVD
jgi:hypothetical protein